MRQRLRSIIRKEFIQALRDPRMRGMLLIPPLIQLLVFGYAVNLDVDTATIAWMDQDNTPASHDLRDEFAGSGRFLIKATPGDERQMQSLLDRGQVDGVIRVLPGFARDVARGKASSVRSDSGTSAASFNIRTITTLTTPNVPTRGSANTVRNRSGSRCDAASASARSASPSR